VEYDKKSKFVRFSAKKIIRFRGPDVKNERPEEIEKTTADILSLFATDLKCMDVWQGVAIDSLKFHPGLPCPTFPCPAGGPPLKRPIQE
jgi:hypothetical protein